MNEVAVEMHDMNFGFPLRIYVPTVKPEKYYLVQFLF